VASSWFLFFSYHNDARSKKHQNHISYIWVCTAVTYFNAKQDRQYAYNVTLMTRSWNHCWRGKEISITRSEYVFIALGIQHAMRMRHIFICSLPRSTAFFLHYLIKRHDFRWKKVLGYQICVLIFSTNFVWSVSHSRKNLTRYDQKRILSSRWVLIVLVGY